MSVEGQLLVPTITASQTSPACCGFPYDDVDAAEIVFRLDRGVDYLLQSVEPLG